jgi:hypothetical protein
MYSFFSKDAIGGRGDEGGGGEGSEIQDSNRPPLCLPSTPEHGGLTIQMGEQTRLDGRVGGGGRGGGGILWDDNIVNRGDGWGIAGHGTQ